MSLHPMCLPGASQFSQIRMDFGGEENRPVHLNMSGILNMNQDPSTQNLYNPNQSYVPDLSNVVNSEDAFGLEASIQAHLGPFQLPNSSKVKLLPIKTCIWGQVMDFNRPFTLLSYKGNLQG